MRLLITGGSSFLGRHLVPLALQQGHQVCSTYFSSDEIETPSQALQRERLDIRDAAAVNRLASRFAPDAILHLAGSDRSADMEPTIVEGARSLRDAAEHTRARLIFLSTDVIFDGRAAPYDELAQPKPRHTYGRAKVAAEEVVAAYTNHVIVRTSLIFGLKIMDRSTEWITSSLTAGKPVTLFTNQLRCPIAAENLSAACLELAHLAYTGNLHVAGSQAVNRAELGRKLLRHWNFEPSELLVEAPCAADAPWPLDTRLDISLAQTVLKTRILGVDEVLTSFLG